MRILLISDHADPLVEIGSKEAGGQNIYVFYLSRFLSRMGFFADVFTRWDRKDKKEVVQLNSKSRVIRIKAGPKKYIPRDTLLNHIDEYATNILKRVEHEGTKYSIIHTNYWFSGLIGLKVAKKLRIPVVHVFHSIGRIRFKVLKKFKMQKKDYDFYQKRLAAEKMIARNVDYIISTSPNEKKSIIKIFKIKEEGIKVIPIGVDLEIFRPIETQKARHMIKLENGRKLIAYVGRIEWRKGIGTLLYAMKEISKKYPKLMLYVIGGGKSKSARELDAAEMNRLQKICRDLGIENSVKFLGPIAQKNLYKYYSASEVVITPSYYEPFGIVPLESMACGTPVVASRTGGLQFTVEDKVTGYLTKPRDYNQLAKKISRILKKGKNKFTENCVKRINENFIWENISIEYCYFLNNLIKKT